MDTSSDFTPILKSFTLLGVNFPGNSKHPRFKLILKRVLNVFQEAAILSFAVYMIFYYIVLYNFPRCMKLTSVSFQITLLILRLSVLCKRNSILRAMKSLENSKLKMKTKKSLRKYVTASCLICFGIPCVMFTNMVILLYQDDSLQVQVLERYFAENLLPRNKMLLLAFLIASHIFTTLHHFIFPALTLNLLIFLYLKYVQTFRESLLALRKSPRNEISSHTMRFLSVLMDATNIYHEIEDAISFITFLGYVMTFINFIGLIPLLSSGYFSEFEAVKNTIMVYVFLWSFFWFTVVTWCGSKMSELRDDVKRLTQHVILHNVDGNAKQNKDLYMLLLMSECASFDLCFTGWEMFRLDRKLILTTIGVIVTYGVLLFKS